MSFTAADGPLQLRIGLLGNPCVFPEWDDRQLQAFVDAGFNAIQLNIAWLRRPNDEPLNLRDVVTPPSQFEEPCVVERRAKLMCSCALARKFNLRTIFHFGSPFMWRNPYTGEVDRTFEKNGQTHFDAPDPWYDVLNPLVVEYEVALLKEFRRQFPDVDDILVYTFDQDAWQAKEFTNVNRSRGIPLHERLPGYLRTLHHVWTEGREKEAMLWWEPWELSAGQIYKCLPALPREGFGMMLHSNIAEVQIALPTCVWFRNMAWLCQELGLPIVSEGFFCSMTEEIEPLSIPCPRLVDEQFKAMTSLPAIVGIKEYFGVLPLVPDLNLDLLRARLASPQSTTDELLEQIVSRFGVLKGKVLRILDRTTDAFRLFPWDASWFARQPGRAIVDHGWTGATVRGQICETPSWDSSRRAHFMKTEDSQAHPFLLEDVQLRCELAAMKMQEALDGIREIIGELTNPLDITLFQGIAVDLEIFHRVAISYALHLRETNVAQMLRDDLAAGRKMTPRLVLEMHRLLEADAANQGQKGRVLQMKALFEEYPDHFIRTQLIPSEETVLENGYHTLTTR